ncbi:GNAT family N-acetyltransferase [Paracoccus sediminis]|nr:GNAT family N-acetyltransferase [Paracoccus sediminis]
MGIELFPADMLPEMIAPFLDGASSELWLGCVSNGIASGFCYARAEEMTEGTWNMLALGVAADLHGQGLGSALVAALEDRLQAQGARIIIVDTSSSDAFARARNFYEKNGYELEARIRDFWADGDDKITFRKKLR